MILAFDTYYTGGTAKTVCISFVQWEDERPAAVYTETLNGIAEYEPGAFYKRELPCILGLLQQVNVPVAEAIIVDGFVYLDDEGKAGLGAHLYAALKREVPVIGVAKTNFATLERNKRALYRGDSARPLYVTAAGMDIDKAAACIAKMHGPNRIPVLLKQLDRLTKEDT